MNSITVTDVTFNLGFIFSYLKKHRSIKIADFEAIPHVVLESERVLYRSDVTFHMEKGIFLKIGIEKPEILYSYSKTKTIPYSIGVFFSLLTGE